MTPFAEATLNAIVCKQCRQLLDAYFRVDWAEGGASCPNCGTFPVEIEVIPASELDDPQHQRYLADRAADAPALPMQPGERLIFRGGNPTFHRSRSEDYDIAVTDQALYFPLTSWAPWRSPPLHRIPISEVHAVRLIPMRSRLWHVVKACVVSAALLSFAVFQLLELSTGKSDSALISTAILGDAAHVN